MIYCCNSCTYTGPTLTLTLKQHWPYIGSILVLCYVNCPPPPPSNRHIRRWHIWHCVDGGPHWADLQNYIRPKSFANNRLVQLVTLDNIGPAMSCYLGYYLNIFIFDKYNWSMIIKMCEYRKNTSITTTKRN